MNQNDSKIINYKYPHIVLRHILQNRIGRIFAISPISKKAEDSIEANYYDHTLI